MEEMLNNFIYTVNHLDAGEIRILVIITAILLVFLVYRLFGIKVAAALLAIYLIGYILYINNFYQVYIQREEKNSTYMNEIQQEADK